MSLGGASQSTLGWWWTISSQSTVREAGPSSCLTATEVRKQLQLKFHCPQLLHTRPYDWPQLSKNLSCTAERVRLDSRKVEYFKNLVHTFCRRTKFYCSEVTKCLLSSDPEFTNLAPYLCSLPMECPVAMKVPLAGSGCPPLSFSVTLLPAGHCPGSVM